MTDHPRPPTTLDEEILEAESVDVESTQTDASRIERVAEELERGFGLLAGVGKAVSLFGSARTPPGHPHYELARLTARRLGEDGFAVITGGGPGIMEAGNRGAQEAGACSIGLRIDLPMEHGLNPYIDIAVDNHYFFTRKVLFVRYASAFVVFPGGFGTLDELFESLTLIQTDKIHEFPVILMGRDYWSGLVDWMRERMLAEGNISPADLDLFCVTDDLDEVLRTVGPVAHRLARSNSQRPATQA